MATAEKIAVTGATGQLGRLVIAALLRVAPTAHLIGIVRNPAAAKDLAARGVELRAGDYEDPAALKAALAGVDKLLLISSSAVGQRARQHRNVIEAAKAAGVKLLAYTSILHADSSPLGLAVEHRETEALIRASGLPFAFLRNGWYTENYTGSIAAVLQHGAVLGSAGTGRIAAAARADFAAAAAAVLASRENQAGKIYELAGDTGFTLGEYAAEIAKQSHKPIVYKDLPEADYKAVLQSVGLPEVFAALLADSDAKAAKGALFDESRQLSRLIGRPTTTMAQSVAAALA
ncbi:NAD(P)-dependent oxidoreductase [Hypericibacter adhaerens]|jgi:NAD(P)H dehydrogenase (quinone)|uniref:NAD(P)-dependent oxidoreductase n=1 Tax=Hypericibacter adhaerens TaxID=2602016 RepID=A0A5J6MVK8_9PROT|nr:SDR family oxidoreductase [Hypericibacter adhaerens]QEX20180.1 NAD(P)-dependent oxidoreductase [Hypericibacter adhaerens]